MRGLHSPSSTCDAAKGCADGSPSATSACVKGRARGARKAAVVESGADSSRGRRQQVLARRVESHNSGGGRFITPAIKDTWAGPKSVTIQHNNASSHNAGVDPDAVATGKQGGWNIMVLKQPAKSPDLNVLDLGLFHSLQSIQHRTLCVTSEDLITAVSKAYADMKSRVRVRFRHSGRITLQAVLEQVMLVCGCNKYKLPHLGQENL